MCVCAVSALLTRRPDEKSRFNGRNRVRLKKQKLERESAVTCNSFCDETDS